VYKIVNKALIAVFCVNSLFGHLQASSSDDNKKTLMIKDLEVIKHHLEAGYAPANWKKENSGWDINEVFENAKNQILITPSISTKQFQQIVRNFMNSMSDYHVDALFFSTEAATLPFSVKGAAGRYFVDWVDPIRLHNSCSGLRVGDEVLTFDDRPIQDVIDEIINTSNKSSNPMSDRGLAEIKLTKRSGKVGDIVPQGVIFITTRLAESKKTLKQQLRWNYTPEYVKNPLDFFQTLDYLPWFPFQSKEKPKLELPKIAMTSPLHQEIALQCAGRDGGLGSRKSFLPPFGEIVWSNERTDDEESEGLEGYMLDKEDDEDALFWHAYIFAQANGSEIGYIRIPHYVLTESQVERFGEIIAMMEERTDALIIDQLHNYGGYVHVQYMLASMLTDEPLQAPYHRIKISQKEALKAHNGLELIKLIEKSIDAMDSQESLKDSHLAEAPMINFQEILFLKAYYELVLEDWNQGRSMTRPTPILGIDRINPHPKYRYTKPIMMLIDEMDFSGGDFMPAIMQDNQRALLFGAKTAGAGGYVFSFEFPNTNGIATCSYTASIAERIDGKKIENLGVSPDIPYQVTIEDLQYGYQGYVEAANKAMYDLLEKFDEGNSTLIVN